MTDRPDALPGRLMVLEDVVARLRALRGRDDPDRVRELVALRRQLATAVVDLAATVRPLLADDAEGARDYGRLHSDLLSRLALHQAEWSAVKVAGESVRYAASARGVDEACATLIAWVRRRRL